MEIVHSKSVTHKAIWVLEVSCFKFILSLNGKIHIILCSLFQKMFLRNRGSLFLWKERWHSKRYLQPCQPHPVLHLTACIRVPLHVDKNAHSQTSPKPYRFSFSRSKCAKQAPPMGLTNTDVWEPHEFKDEPEIQVVCHRCHSHLSLKGSRGLCPWSKEVEGAGRLSTICDPGWILVQEKDLREATDDIWKMSED